jgi:hypothetical protein
MGKQFKNVGFGDEIYVVSVFVVFNGRGDNRDNELMKKIEGICPMLSRYDSSGPSTFFVTRTLEANERIRRLLLSTEKVKNENDYAPQTARLTTIDINNEESTRDFVINRTYGGSIKIYSTSLESLKKVYNEVVDALLMSESKRCNRKMSSLMELKTRKL